MKKSRSDRIADVGFFLFSVSTVQAIDLVFGVPVTWSRVVTGFIFGALLFGVAVALWVHEESATATEDMHSKKFGKPRP